MIDPMPSYPIVAAEGTRLRLADGRELIDGMSSWWCVIHGYNHPVLNAALAHQLGQMAHVMFGGLTHKPALELARRLVQLTPAPLDRVFFSDSGSVAVEIAIKMALQYWQARGRSGKNRLLSIRNGYHGDTLGAMSVCDPVTGMHHLFKDIVPKQLFAPAPACRFHDVWEPESIAAFSDLLEQNRARVAAVILEPIVQGAGGMRFYHPRYLREVRTLCDQHDVLLIADEIAVGFGRTGRLFACEHAEITPDILCVGKALTGGYMTLAATLTTEHIAETISTGGARCFMHGPTFMANPLACRVATASIDLLLDSPWQHQIQGIETQLRTELAPCQAHPAVRDVRVLGAIGVVEMEAPVDLRCIQPQFVERGVWLRPFGRLIYTMPPYIIGPDDLSCVTAAIRETIKSLET
jgi:adenosylmethionine-8-amino-7-oxononanoate aminotransferase